MNMIVSPAASLSPRMDRLFQTAALLLVMPHLDQGCLTLRTWKVPGIRYTLKILATQIFEEACHESENGSGEEPESPFETLDILVGYVSDFITDMCRIAPERVRNELLTFGVLSEAQRSIDSLPDFGITADPRDGHRPYWTYQAIKMIRNGFRIDGV